MAVQLSSSLSHASCPALEDLAVLRDFSESDRRALASAGSTVLVPQAREIIAEDSSHETVFIILAGKFLVSRQGLFVAELGVGQIFGEMEVLNPPQASASVSALAGGSVWRITRSQIRQFMAAYPRAGNQFMGLLTSTFAARLRE